MNNKNNTLPTDPMGLEDTNPLNNAEGQIVQRPRLTPEEWKKTLMTTGITLAAAAVPFVYYKMKDEGDTKITKGKLFDIGCYTVPSLISLAHKASIGTGFERGLAKAEFTSKFLLLIPVFSHLIKNEKGKKGIKRLDMDVVIKSIPFATNMLAPQIVADPSMINSIIGLATTFGTPIIMLTFGKSKDPTKQKLASSAPYIINALKSVAGYITKNNNNSGHGGQYSTIFGNNNYNQNNSGSMINDLGTVAANLTKIFVNGANNGTSFAGNSVYGSNNRNYYDRPI